MQRERKQRKFKVNTQANTIGIVKKHIISGSVWVEPMIEPDNRGLFEMERIKFQMENSRWK